MTVRTAKVFVGPLEQVLRISGSTSARNFASIVAPMMRGPDSGRNLVLMKLVAAGHVGKQETVVLLLTGHTLKDPEYTIDFHRGKLLTAQETAAMDTNQRKQMNALASAPQVLEPTTEAVMRVLDAAVQGRSEHERVRQG